jgi:hypothetical protein
MTTALQSPSLINDFADFLAQSPSPDQIAAWRPSLTVERRFRELVEKRRDEFITTDETHELEAYLNSEIVLSLLKARLRGSGAPRG